MDLLEKIKAKAKTHNKRIQSDQATRYARALAADAERYKAGQ